MKITRIWASRHTRNTKGHDLEKSKCIQCCFKRGIWSRSRYQKVITSRSKNCCLARMWMKKFAATNACQFFTWKSFQSNIIWFQNVLIQTKSLYTPLIPILFKMKGLLLIQNLKRRFGDKIFLGHPDQPFFSLKNYSINFSDCMWKWMKDENICKSALGKVLLACGFANKY